MTSTNYVKLDVIARSAENLAIFLMKYKKTWLQINNKMGNLPFYCYIIIMAELFSAFISLIFVSCVFMPHPNGKYSGRKSLFFPKPNPYFFLNFQWRIQHFTTKKGKCAAAQKF